MSLRARNSRNDERPGNQGFKKSAEFARSWIIRPSLIAPKHSKTSVLELPKLAYPWKEKLPNLDDFLNPGLPVFCCFLKKLTNRFNQKYPQYCQEVHDQLREALSEPLLKKEESPAVLGGREFWKSSGSLKCLEL